MTLVSKRLPRQFGDFQTPTELAKECCRVIDKQLGIQDTAVEPTCGRGNFFVEAIKQFRSKQFVGLEQNANYVRACRRAVTSVDGIKNVRVSKRNFFELDWNCFRETCGERVLFFGNPPWVTNAEIGTIGGDNLPTKKNSASLRGLDAVTGKSNFDIAESMIQTLLAAMRPGKDSLAMLVKSATARRVADDAWKRGYRFKKLHFYQINAKEHFDASVDAGLMLLSLGQAVDRGDSRSVNFNESSLHACRVYDQLTATRSAISFGRFNGKLVRDPELAKRTSHLSVEVKDSKKALPHKKASITWRSGVKHDLARVLELNLQDGELLNRDGDRLDIEPDHVFPLAKGSDVASGLNRNLSRVVLIPQLRLGQSTLAMQRSAPKTYAYLCRHSVQFEARRSSIYRSQDPFAIFGVGDYTFSRWKVAICGLYKRLTFTVYGPVQRKPVVFDDTTYLLPCRGRSHAMHVKQLLDSESAKQFFDARIFWEAKRPINAAVLRSLDLRRVAQEEGVEDPG